LVLVTLLALGIVTTFLGTPVAAQETDAEIVAGINAMLDDLLVAYHHGQLESAESLRADAYLLGFERIEGRLRTVDPILASEIEGLLGIGGTLEAQIAARVPIDALEETVAAVRAKLADSRERLVGRMDAGVAFTNSLILIAREGFEAVLIVGAIVGYLHGTKNPGKVRTVYLWSGAGVLASLATAFLIWAFLSTQPAHRELLEGVTSLLAVAVLFYVSYWLISKVQSDQWMRFIKGKLKAALATGSGVALGLVPFFAVYREGFETVLFYGALGAQANGVEIWVAAGFVAGLGILAVVFLAFHKFAVRIPIRKYFAFTSGLLYYLTVSFAGYGIHELQEAGIVSATPAAWIPRIEALNLYPTLETLTAQLVLVAALVFALVFVFVLRPVAEVLARRAQRGAGVP
jgi:high-affinity iron transporter